MPQPGTHSGWVLLARPQDSSGSPGEVLQLICIVPLTLSNHPGRLEVELEFASGMGREVWLETGRELGDRCTTVTLRPARPGQVPLARALELIQSGGEVAAVTELRIYSGQGNPTVLCREKGGIRFVEEGRAKA